jgi:general nucleoside transport system permease protein
MDIFYQLVQDTYISMTVLLIVALGGLLAERSGVTNIALEGIMIMGAFLGIWSVKGLEVFPFSPLTKFIIFFVSFIVVLAVLYSIYLVLHRLLKFKLKKNILLIVLGVASLVIGFLLFSVLSNQEMNKHLILIMGIIIGGVIGGLYAMLHAYAAIFMKSDQVISATALNLFAPAFAVFTARIIQNGGGQQIGFSSTFRIQKIPFLGDIPVIGELLFTRVYLSFYIGLALLGILWVVIYKTKFGLRLRACGENPHAADSLGINIYRLRFIAVTLSGFFAGMGGVIFVATTSTEFNVTVAGFGFLAIAVLIFGNWRPSRIVMAALFFGFMRTIASSYSVIPFLSVLDLPTEFYNMVPYLATLIILAFFSKNSRAPKALGQIYDQGKR